VNDIPLPAKLEEELQAHESDRHHIPAARAVLERAIIAQVQLIADGLIAHRLLCGHSLDRFAWVAQVLSRGSEDAAAAWGTLERASAQATGGTLAGAMQGMATAFIAKHPPSVEEFERDFHLRVFRREVTRITPEQLRTLTIRIFGTRVPFWQEGRINAQLAMLGSDLRLFIAAADQLRAASILSSLGIEPREPVSPLIFLLGRTRPCTSLFKAQLFEFDHELAVSPYLHTTSPGLVDQCRIVLRHRFWHGIAQNYPVGPLADGFCEEILSHERGHIVTKYGFIFPGHFADWRSIMRADLCRFAQRPVKYGEINVTFSRTFDFFESTPVLSMGLLPPDEPRETLKLIDLLSELVEDGMMERMADGRYLCRRYEEGRAWSIE
jgi:hypothetical protein